MAIIFLDSFSHYSTPQILRKWTTFNDQTFNGFNGIVVPTFGRCGQAAMTIAETSDTTTGTGPCYVTAPVSAFAIGAAVWLWNGVQGSGRCVFRLNSGGINGVNRQLELVIHTDNTFELGTGTSSGAFGGNITTSYGKTTQAIQGNSWHYVELVGTISATVGTLQLWVDNVKLLDLSGLNTDPVGSGTWNTLQLGATYGTAVGNTGAAVPAGTYYYNGTVPIGSAITQGIMFSDFYLGTATADRKGDSRVYARLPTGDGSLTQWTPSIVRSHYLNVNENPADDDTTYNSAITTGLVDLYTFPTIGIPSGTVYALQALALLRKDIPGAGLAGIATQLAGVNYTGPAQAISDASYLYYLQVFDTNDPAGNAWTVANANAVQVGAKVLT